MINIPFTYVSLDNFPACDKCSNYMTYAGSHNFVCIGCENNDKCNKYFSGGTITSCGAVIDPKYLGVI